MTAIAGVVHGGKVYLGGDSASVGEMDIRTSLVPKVFRNGPFVIGYTTSWRMGQLLQHSLRPPKRDACQSIEQFMVTDFIDAVRGTLKDGGFASRESEVEHGGTFLVGYEGRLFEVNSDYQVNENAYGFAAVGCGESYLYGALYALSTLAPEKRIRRALEAAQEFSAGVRGPFTVVREP